MTDAFVAWTSAPNNAVMSLLLLPGRRNVLSCQGGSWIYKSSCLASVCSSWLDCSPKTLFFSSLFFYFFFLSTTGSYLPLLPLITLQRSPALTCANVFFACCAYYAWQRWIHYVPGNNEVMSIAALWANGLLKPQRESDRTRAINAHLTSITRHHQEWHDRNANTTDEHSHVPTQFDSGHNFKEPYCGGKNCFGQQTRCHSPTRTANKWLFCSCFSDLQ